MKIDTFDLDLFSSRSYFESSKQQVTGELKFLELVNKNMDQSLDQAQTRQKAVQTSTEQEVIQAGQWCWPVESGGQPELSLTERFKAELDKMKQMLDAIMDSFSNMGVVGNSSGGSFHLSRISQGNSNYFFGNSAQSSARLSAYEYSYSTYTYSKSEQTRFSADGIINTLDGNEINFSFEMNMERSFFREESFSWTRTGYDLIDPLIVNAGVTTPQFSGAGFSFDLDLDGSSEGLRPPAPGTGFLSLAKNRDKLINNGSELFGPSAFFMQG
ncbi:MAG: hypothetical protein GY860_18595 [Desulfobacteraceae bacterium]|nr:hypothetical protein [Desulfobacteraceae bacterium]